MSEKLTDIFPTKTDYPTEPYFRIQERVFFRFVDTTNIPAGRQLAAFKYYMQLRTNTDETFLLYFHKAMETVLSDNKSIQLEKLFELKNMLGDRLNWAFHPDIVLRYASICYLDANENPFTYDEKYNDEKIKWWKENTDIGAFFLAEPLMKLMPHSIDADVSLPTYSAAVIEADILQHKKLLQVLSATLKLNGDDSSISARITMLETLRDYATNQQTSTSYTSKSDIQLLKK